MSKKIFSYKTISRSVESKFTDRGSKFLGFCVEVEDREEIKKELKAIKEAHPKASHYCYAWRLGIEGVEFRTSDNGEPSGSAGRPIMRQIDSVEATNILVVVVRYFGGTLLGIPGLINAYKTAAAECLAATTIIEKDICKIFSLTFDYTQMDAVMKLIKHLNLEIINQEMALFCKFKLKIPLQYEDEFKVKISMLDEVELLKN